MEEAVSGYRTWFSINDWWFLVTPYYAWFGKHFSSSVPELAVEWGLTREHFRRKKRATASAEDVGVAPVNVATIMGTLMLLAVISGKRGLKASMQDQIVEVMRNFETKLSLTFTLKLLPTLKQWHVEVKNSVVCSKHINKIMYELGIMHRRGLSETVMMSCVVINFQKQGKISWLTAM